MNLIYGHCVFVGQSRDQIDLCLMVSYISI